MDIQTFIQNFKEAFGENAELPLVFWYSDEQKGETEKINGCFFKGMKTVRDGGIISLNAENIGCGGGKFYTGFTEMPEPTYRTKIDKLMDIQTFIQNFKEAFGENAELPLVFWYSDEQKGETEKINGCFFKGMKTVRDGGIISLNAENIGCGGGKFYTGFTEMPERVPTFVSLKEKYKQTPEMVIDFIQQIGVPRTENKYLHFARIDKVESLEEIEGVVFLANPDMLSGLTTWAFYDNNAADCVVSTFGSGCSAVVTQATIENRKGGKRTFLGFFDPSVRPHFEADKLSYTIPMSRFKEMYETMRQSCLFDTHAWGKIKERMNG